MNAKTFGNRSPCADRTVLTTALYPAIEQAIAPPSPPAAAGYTHPTETVEKDGSLLVSFRASRHLEMCWYLYSRGRSVEVL